MHEARIMKELREERGRLYLIRNNKLIPDELEYERDVKKLIMKDLETKKLNSIEKNRINKLSEETAR